MTGRVRVAVIGAGGRIGSALLAHLSLHDRISAVGVCRNAVVAGPLRLAGLEVRCGSITDDRSANALVGDHDVVINCAIDAGWPGTARKRNRHMLRALYGLRDARVIVQFSSVAVYGTYINRERSTFGNPRPHSLFAYEKLDLERFQRGLARRSAVKTFILRVGHVYGPYQWLSRAVFDLLSTSGERLPFDGQLPSNAIHIGNVCRALEWLILAEPPPGTLNLVDRPQRIWRELVDWHAQVMRAPPLPAMDAGESLRLARAHKADEAVPHWLAFAREVWTWFSSLPSSFLLSGSVSRTIGGRLLAALESEHFEQRLQALYAVMRARQSVARSRSATPQWLFSDEVPGPIAEYPSQPLSEEDATRLATWYAGYSDPAMLAGSGVSA